MKCEFVKSLFSLGRFLNTINELQEVINLHMFSIKTSQKTVTIQVMTSWKFGLKIKIFEHCECGLNQWAFEYGKIQNRIWVADSQCVKNDQFCSFSGSHFPAFELNTESLRIQARMRENADQSNSEYGNLLRSVSEDGFWKLQPQYQYIFTKCRLELLISPC